MDWSYLDKMDKNLLYVYAKGLGQDNRVHLSRQLFDLNNYEGANNETMSEIYSAEKWLKTAYYLLWFVFRYVLGCKTLAEAEQAASISILKQYNLLLFFKKRHIYVGVYGINAVYLYNVSEDYMEDVKIALEIVYNRYNYFEQLDCFMRRSQKYQSVKKCKRILDESIGLVQHKQSCKPEIEKYRERMRKK